MFIPALSLAEIDISGLTLDELIVLGTKVQERIFELSDTREVKVPVGTYTVGVHIPAGEYSMRPAGMFSWIEIDNAPDAYGSHWQMYNMAEGETAGRVVLYDGDVVNITMGTMIFVKFTGLGF
jgi:hypothetical protein